MPEGQDKYLYKGHWRDFQDRCSSAFNVLFDKTFVDWELVLLVSPLRLQILDLAQNDSFQIFHLAGNNMFKIYHKISKNILERRHWRQYI